MTLGWCDADQDRVGNQPRRDPHQAATQGLWEVEQIEADAAFVSNARNTNKHAEGQAAIIAKMRKELEQIEYIDAGGCLDGDCPHDKANECLTVMFDELRLVGETVRDVLAATKKGD